MSKKKLYNNSGIVYSTAPDFKPDGEAEIENFLLPKEQSITVILDKKHRGGKVVSIVKGFAMKADDLETLAKNIKTFCGSGGTAKDNEIIIQGDQREKILQWLLKKGYSKARKI